jgi:5-methylcytosine-specific restriction enzyme A
VPYSPARPCSQPRCPAVVTGRSARCPAHPYERRQSGASGLHSTYRWQKARRAFLALNPWCVSCLREGRRTPATEVDHIDSLPSLFWLVSNWQPLCKSCHSRKTARRDGGWGRPRRPADSPSGAAP